MKENNFTNNRGRREERTMAIHLALHISVAYYEKNGGGAACISCSKSL